MSGRPNATPAVESENTIHKTAAQQAQNKETKIKNQNADTTVQQRANFVALKHYFQSDIKITTVLKTQA